MTPLLLALAMMAAPDDLANTPNWVELGRDDYHGIQSMARDTLRAEGPIRYVRMRVVRPESAVVADLAINCTDKTQAPIVVYFYFDGRLASDVTYRPSQRQFHPIAKDSLFVRSAKLCEVS